MTIQVVDHQNVFQVDLPRLQGIAERAVPPALGNAAFSENPLASLDVVEVSLIDDETIAQVHLDFMAIPGATDVITFDHGEILVSTETAAQYALEFGHERDRELALYIIHGLLHLAGHGDKEKEEASRMKSIQEGILEALWPMR